MLKARGFWGAVGLFVGLLILAGLAAPQVEQFTPNAQSPHVSARTPVRIRFNRDMDRVSVEARLSISPEVAGEVEWEGRTLVFHPAQPWPSGTVVQVSLQAGARSAQFIPILSSKSWSFEVGRPRLAYLWPADSAAELYLYDLASEQRELITETEAGVLDYAVSGTALVYVELGEDGTTALRALDLTTGAERIVFECPATARCQSPALDADGERLAFERFEWQISESGQRVPGPSQIWWMPLSGEQEPRALPPEGQSLQTPSWSVSGILAYYNETLQAVGLIQPETSRPAQLVPNGLGLLGCWSPDGRYLVLPEIAFPVGESEGQADFYSHLYRVDALSTEVTELSQGSVEDASPSYSPDGNWIAFARKYLDENWTPGRQLWLMRADGGRSHPISSQPDFSHAALSWSPDSQSLAYMLRSQTDPNLPPQIWITDLSGEQQHMLIDGGYLPKWLP